MQVSGVGTRTRAQRYGWPGNIRELQNVIERAVIASRVEHLTLDRPETTEIALAPAPFCSEPAEVIPEEEWRNRERANILAALQRARFSRLGEGGAPELGSKPHYFGLPPQGLGNQQA